MLTKILSLLFLGLTANAQVSIGNFDLLQKQPNFTNYIQNPNAEKNDLGVTDASSIHSRTTTTPINNLASHLIDASATSQNVDFLTNDIPTKIAGQACLAEFWLNGDASLYTAQVLNGSTGLNEALTLPNVASNARLIQLNFPCPADLATNDLKIRIASTGNGAAIRVDDLYLGQATNVGSVAQATIYAAANFVATTTGTCTMTQNTSTSESNYVTQSTGSGCPAWTVSGPISIPTSSLAVTATNLPPGEYEITLTAPFFNGTQNTICNFRFSDGTNGFGSALIFGATTGTLSQSVLTGRIRYTTPQSSVTWSVQSSDSGTTSCNISPDTAGRTVFYTIKRFPLESETAVAISNTPWFVSATLGGADVSLGTANVTSYTELTNASLTLTPTSGSQPVGVMCSATNAATAPSNAATTCSAGSESVGINFSIPEPGLYEVCSGFSHWINIANAGGSFLVAGFQLVETATNAQTILQEGGDRRTNVEQSSVSKTGDSFKGFPHRSCGVFSFATPGIKGVRLMYEQEITNTPLNSYLNADGNASRGQPNISFLVTSLTRQTPQVLLPNSISTGSTSPYRTIAADINCDGASVITSQSGGVSTVGNRSTTSCALTLQSGFFSTSPNSCNVTVKSATVQSTSCNCTSSTACTIYGPNADYDAYVHIMGPR